MKWRTAAQLEAPGIAHGFFSRAGGVSGGLYESLNCGPGSKDDPHAVAENRRRIAAALTPEGPERARLISLSQIHSAIVHSFPAWQEPGEGDAMVTATPGLALGILTADCAPVLLADAKAKVIGAAHAGWKGALGGVLEATLDAMARLGAQPDRIAAAIGPCISQVNYEVGWDFRDRFLEQGLRHRRFFTPSGKEGHYCFDLEAYVAHRLDAAGVGRVEKLGVCTYPPENGYFSFRRATHAGEPDYGRQISAIVLTG
ncbi:MAG TPA: peptidoglycan editing factor PgeF [Rhizomicrobium sp.]|nr:peptidoglycan editing factor PgeF [Rhizomicrobium sp.]